MSSILRGYRPDTEPQTVRTNARQVQNDAGGYVYAVEDRERLERFLILGVEGGTYYVGKQAHLQRNVDFLGKALASDPKGFIDTVVAVSSEGRAPKNSPAIFAIAFALANAGDEYKAYARAAVAQVCRTSTHLFELAEYIENLGGWGRSKRSAVASWYTDKTPDELAFQAVKYRQRNGWTHRDMLRLSHPALGNEYKSVADFILGKDSDTIAPKAIEGFRKVQAAKSGKEAVGIVAEYRLPWETVPTEYLNDADLWRSMFEQGFLGHTALLRNLNRMDKLGLFNDLVFESTVAKFLTDPVQVKKGRLHPIAYLNALNNSGVTGTVRQGLIDGFYVAFGNVVPSNARTMIGLDVSGSMGWEDVIGLKGMNCREAAAAMATVTARTEPYVFIGAFTTNFVKVNVNKDADLDQMTRAISNLRFGGTDASQPIQYALANNIAIDHFIIYTDNDTYGSRHVDSVLREYRRKTGIDAKLTVVGLSATDFTIGDPEDTGTLNVCGFDTTAPAVIAEFARV